MTAAQFARFWSRVNTAAGPTGCWRWRGVHNRQGGRERKRWKKHGRRPRTRVGKDFYYVAPLMLLLLDPSMRRAVGYLKLEACHTPGVCGQAWCINPAHLYWGSKADNLRDRYPMKKAR